MSYLFTNYEIMKEWYDRETDTFRPSPRSLISLSNGAEMGLFLTLEQVKSKHMGGGGARAREGGAYSLPVPPTPGDMSVFQSEERVGEEGVECREVGCSIIAAVAAATVESGQNSGAMPKRAQLQLVQVFFADCRNPFKSPFQGTWLHTANRIWGFYCYP